MCFAQRARALPIVIVAAVMASAWGAGCGGEVRVGADANLTCESDSDCPRPHDLHGGGQSMCGARRRA